MEDLVNITIGTAGATALLGYAVVFFALVLLMSVLYILGAVMKAKAKKQAVSVGDIEAPRVMEAVPLEIKAMAPGSAGELKLYDTAPRTAAMLMAIVADEMHAPLNELRFLSIREIKEDKD